LWSHDTVHHFKELVVAWQSSHTSTEQQKKIFKLSLATRFHQSKQVTKFTVNQKANQQYSNLLSSVCLLISTIIAISPSLKTTEPGALLHSTVRNYGSQWLAVIKSSQ